MKQHTNDDCIGISIPKIKQINKYMRKEEVVFKTIELAPKEENIVAFPKRPTMMFLESQAVPIDYQLPITAQSDGLHNV
jgi:hypothetical protein